MASGKKSFVLYADLIHTFELLDDASAGKLMKHLLRYVNDLNPETDDLLLKVAFEPIKRQLKRDLKDWDDIREKRSEYGHTGGVNSGKTRRKKKIEANEANASKSKQVEANEAVTVTVNVNDTVNVTKNTDERKNSFLTNRKWKEEFCMAKSLDPPELERLQKEFISDCDLKQQYVDSYPKYFTNWFNSKINGKARKQSNSSVGKTIEFDKP